LPILKAGLEGTLLILNCVKWEIMSLISLLIKIYVRSK
jgi:hypothetical protein